MATFPQEPGKRWTRSRLLPACWRAWSQHPGASWNIRDGFYYRTLRYKHAQVVLSTHGKACSSDIFCCLDSSSDSSTSDDTLDGGPESSLQRHGWSAATLRVLSSMPSRSAGEMKPFPFCQLVCYTRYIYCLKKQTKKTDLFHTGPNSNAGVRWRGSKSRQPSRHHPSRPNQDDVVRAEVVEITPEGG